VSFEDDWQHELDRRALRDYLGWPDDWYEQAQRKRRQNRLWRRAIRKLLALVEREAAP
jgi:hypothetical protein